MSDLNDPLKESYIGKVADAITAYVDELKAKGFDPTSRIDQLTQAGRLIEGASKVRKAAEKALAEAIASEQALRDQFYKLATETVSLAEGLLGKTPSAHRVAARPARRPHRQPKLRQRHDATGIRRFTRAITKAKRS
jgi:hypothetical protein